MARIIALLISLIYMINFQWIEDYGNEMAMLIIILAGIPHGATDHVLTKLINQKKEGIFPSKIILNYLGISLVYLIVWIVSPLKGFLIFIAISIFHFGQEYIEYLQIKSFRSILTFQWGCFVLLFPLIYHSTETVIYINELTGVVVKPIHSSYLSIITIVWPLIVTLSIGLMFYAKKIAWPEAKRWIIDLWTLTYIFLTLPLIPAFAIFFVFWHSADTYQQLFHFYRFNKPNWTKIDFIKSFIPLSLISFVGLILIAGLINISSSNLGYSWVFVFISLISLPHIFLFDNFYQNQFKMVNEKEKNFI